MPLHTALLAAVFCLAGLVQGFSGFGFGLVAMALLPAAIDFHLAYWLVIVFTIPVSGLTLFRHRAHYRWRPGLSLIIGVCCGVPIGLYLLTALPKDLLIRLLGASMIGVAANELVFAREESTLPAVLGFPLGVISGLLGGAFNMGGPPAVAYLYSRPWPKQQIMAALQVVILVSTVIRLPLISTSAWPGTSLFNIGLWATLPVVVGVAAGTHFFHRVSQERLRFGVFLFLGVMGAKYLLWP